METCNCCFISTLCYGERTHSGLPKGTGLLSRVAPNARCTRAYTTLFSYTVDSFVFFGWELLVLQRKESNMEKSSALYLHNKERSYCAIIARHRDYYYLCNAPSRSCNRMFIRDGELNFEISGRFSSFPSL